MAVLIGVASGSLFGWQGNRIVVAGPEQGFCNNRQQYDEFTPGSRVGDADLPRFCLSLVDFHASYLDSGQSTSFRARMTYDVYVSS